MNAICANCGAVLNGKYCHECGQKATVGRLKMHDLFHELWHAFTHTDKGILRLIKDLAISPKSVYINYLGGQRKKYFSPILFFLVTAGIVAYLYGFVYDHQDKKFHTLDEFGRDLAHLTKYRALILLPIDALLTWLVFRKRFNLAEVTAFWLFCLGFIYTINIILIPFYFPLIRHKDTLDDIIAVMGYLIIFWHGSLVLANRSLLNIIVFFLVLNVIFVIDAALQLYLTLGKNFNDPYMGVSSIWDLIKSAYSFGQQ